MTLDLPTIRRQFPALQQSADAPSPIFFDGPGGTQAPQQVIAAISNYWQSGNSNLGGAYAHSAKTNAIAQAAREATCDFLNASRPEEIVFGQNMTSLTFALSRALSQTWQAGDEIIVTQLDHDANITPWVLAAQDRGVTVRQLTVDLANCSLQLDTLPSLLTSRTRLVAVTLASNAVGTITDIARVVAMAQKVGALVFVDGVQFAPHGVIDVQAWGCDFFACSAYKFFGPQVGVLYGRYALLEELPAYKVRPSNPLPPGKWETGTQNWANLAGVTAAIDYLASLGEGVTRRDRLVSALEKIGRYERGLSTYFLFRSRLITGLRIYGIVEMSELEARVPTFAFSVAGYTPRQVAQHLAKDNIYVWDGHYYAVSIMEQLGLLTQGGLVRVGFVHYNCREEIDLLCTKLEALSR